MNTKKVLKIKSRFFALVFLVLSISIYSGKVFSQKVLRLSTGDTINYTPDPRTLTIYLTNRLCHECSNEIVNSALIDSLVKYSRIKVDVVFVGGTNEIARLNEYKLLKKTIDKSNIFQSLDFKKETSFIPSPYIVIYKEKHEFLIEYSKLYKTETLNLNLVRKYLFE